MTVDNPSTCADASQLRALFDHFTDVILVADDQGRYLDANPSARALTGYDREELLTMCVGDLTPPELRAEWLDHWRTFLARGASRGVYELRRKDGGRVAIEYSAVPNYLPGRHVSFFRDVTARTQLEKQIRGSRDMLLALLDSITDPLFLLDADNRVLLLNTPALHGIRENNFGAVVGQKLEWFLPRLVANPDHQGRILALVSEGRPAMLELWTRDDPKRIELFMVHPVAQGRLKGQGRVLRVMDLTHIRFAEEQLARKDKLASLGLLVSSFMHEINNPNNFLVLNIPVLRDYLEEVLPIVDAHARTRPELRLCGMSWPDLREDLSLLLQNMEHGSERITKIVARLKGFLSGDGLGLVSEIKVVQPGEVIRKALMMCASWMHKQNVIVQADLDRAPERLRTSPGVLEQALVNLLTNAVQAMDKPDRWVKIRAVQGPGPSPCLILEVRDNGRGMDPRTRAGLFQPFFSTKESGSGLGLYISRKLVEHLGGTLEAESIPGRGSLFRVVLPEAGQTGMNEAGDFL
ncbi:PAS domain S-box-containing protein [Desulfonatronum zhilinae]|nr:PAS domain S-box-containing protein [Desulfonatronum zhilinae]